MFEDAVHDELVLVRTAEGQALAFDETRLAASDRRLLRLVNGFTPLGSLAARLDVGHDWHASASQLLREGLVAVEPH